MYTCFCIGVRNFAEALEKEFKEKRNDESAAPDEDTKDSGGDGEVDKKEDKENAEKDNSIQ